MKLKELVKQIKGYIENEASEVTIFSSDSYNWDYEIDSEIKQNDYSFVLTFDGYNFNVGKTQKDLLHFIENWFELY